MTGRSERSRAGLAWRCLLSVLVALLCSQCAHHPSPAVTGPDRAPRLSMNTTTSRWTARDGKELPFTKWPGEPASPRAVLICVHGLSGAASDFWPVGESFPAHGYAVYGMQLRGQGNDPDISARGDIRNRRQWMQDLRDFTKIVQQQHPDRPIYWYGESLGALITIYTAADADRRPPGVAGIILSSPVVALRENLELRGVKNIAVRTLMKLIPGKRISLEALGNSEVQVTSHTTHREQMQHTSHYVKDFTLRLFGEIERFIRCSGAAAEQITLPVLVLYTPHDVLTSREGVEHFLGRLASRDKTKVFFPDSYHLILHDVDRQAALINVRAWLDRRTHRPARHD